MESLAVCSPLRPSTLPEHYAEFFANTITEFATIIVTDIIRLLSAA